MRKSIVKVRIYQSDKLFILLYDDAFGNIRQVVQFVFYFFGIDILSAGTEQHVLAASLDGYIALGIHQRKVTGVQSTVCINSLTGGFFIFIVSQHDVRSAAYDFSRYVFRIRRKDFHFHTGDSLTAGTRFEA